MHTWGSYSVKKST